MAKFITKHRRGTTDEWDKSNVILEDGEIVVEECPNGSTKLKIGDGIRTFRDLDYVTGDLENEVASINEILSNHIKFNEGEDFFGENTVESELVAARTSKDGTTYPTVGERIKATETHIDDLRGSVSDFIDKKAVDGLHYDNTDSLLYLTANGELIETSAVKIVSGSGGGGGSGSSSLKIGYITQSPLVVTPSDTAIIRYTFSGEDTSGDPVTEGVAKWRVGDKVVLTETIRNGENSFDATEYLTIGTQKVFLSITDNSDNLITKTWNVQKVDVRLESSFNDTIKYPLGTVPFEYTPYGAVDKTVHFILDGELLGTVNTTASGTPLGYAIPEQSHGAHLLEVYMTTIINENPIESNHVLKDIIWYDQTSTTPVIGASQQKFTARQYDTVNIDYTVYDPSTETPTVVITVDGDIVATPTLVNPTATYSFRTDVVGDHIIKITCGKTEKKITANITKLDIDITPVTAGLAFDFNPSGKSNNDSDRLWTDGNVSMSVSDNFDWINGGYQYDDNGDQYFCVKSGTYALIDYNLFADDAKLNGKEMKFVFKTTNVSKPDATFLHCVDSILPSTDGYFYKNKFYSDKGHTYLIDGVEGSRYCDVSNGKYYSFTNGSYIEATSNLVGVRMDAHEAFICGATDRLHLAYSEEDIIEFEFNISKNTEAIPMVMGYEDGVSTRPMVYNSSFNFTQNSPKLIYLGSEDCDLHIYRFKVYSTSLTDIGILNNFIADARNVEEMISRYNRNQIYDENQKLDPDVLAEKCPWLRIIKLEAPYFTNHKDNKVPNTTVEYIYKNGDRPEDNWIATDAVHSGQGTSSNNYGASGRNLDVIVKLVKDKKTGLYLNKNPIFTLSDGKEKSKVSLTANSVPVNYFNIKVNIASSNNLTNPLLAKRYNDFEPYTRPFVRDDASEIPKIKDTMEFHNCVVFIKETDKDLTTHREFADNDWHFYAIGNIGDSKKTDSTRLTDKKDKYECCVEIMDVELPLSDFPVDTMYNAMGYEVDEKTEEKIYTWAKDENLGILYEKIDGEYVLTQDTTVDLTKTYYVDILENDDFSEDYTYGFRYIYEDGTDEENEEVFNYCKQKWIDFYRFVTTSTDAEFKEKFDDYFVKDSALYNYLFTTRYCMVDNRAKNTFWHYGKTGEVDENGNPIRKWDLTWGYDMDSSLGLNNYGMQAYRYGLEDIDVDENGDEVFREMDSTFFCRVRDNFKEELKALYNLLDSAWNAESFINQCDAWQDEFPEELWRIDIDRKYIRTYNSSFINGAGDSQFLVNMSNGKMKYQRRQWERSQEKYMASKYQSSVASGDNSVFRCSVPTGELVVQPNYRLKLTPYAYMYLNVKYGTQSPIQLRAEPNKEYEIPFDGDKVDIISIYSSSLIQDFGDLSTCYPTTADTSKAKKIKRLVLGNSTPGYSNPGFTTLTTGANSLLEYLNVENVSGLTQSLELSALNNLKELYAHGSNIGGVVFANGGKIEIAELPSVGAVTLKNLLYLKELDIVDFNNLTTLVVENCDTVDALSILDVAQNLSRVRITGVDWKLNDASLLMRLANMSGVDSNGNNTTTAVIAGKAFIRDVTGEEYGKIIESFPDLDVTFASLTSKVYFLDEDDNVISVSTLYNPIVAGTTVNPDGVTLVIIPSHTVTRQPDAQYTYSHEGWTRIKGSYEEDVGVFNNILADRYLYPRFVPSVRNYKVRFFTGSELIYEDTQPYGSTISYSPSKAVESAPDRVRGDGTPIKQGTGSPDMYKFVSFMPSDINTVLADTDFYAEFVLSMDGLVGASLTEFEYSLDDTNKTISLNKYIAVPNDEENDSDSMTFIPDKYTVYSGDSPLGDYTVTSVGGFDPTDPSGKVVISVEFVDLPDTVETIQPGAFSNCTKLMKAEIGPNVSSLGTSAFSNCASIEEVEYNAKNATIPGVSITTSPFIGVSSESGFNVIIGNTVESIPQFLFGKSALLTPSVASIQWKVNADGSTNCKSIGASAFRNAIPTVLEIPDGVLSIGNLALSGDNYHTEITPIKTSEDTSIARIPNTLTNLDAGAFNDWSKLKVLHLPGTLTNIGGAIARSCPEIEEIVVDAGSRYVSSFNCLIDSATHTLIQGCKGSTVLGGESGVKKIGDRAFEGSGIQSPEDPKDLLPESITTIGSYAFSRCASLTEVVIPSKVTYVPTQCFEFCTNLHTITIHDNVSSLGTFLFWGCTSLNNVKLPASLVNIPGGCFIECTGLDTVEIPPSVRAIDKNAFTRTGFKEFILPDSVQIVSTNSFDGCQQLETFTFGTGVQKIGGSITDVTEESCTPFIRCTNLKTINCPFSEDSELAQTAPWGAQNTVQVVYNYGSGNEVIKTYN